MEEGHGYVRPGRVGIFSSWKGVFLSVFLLSSWLSEMTQTKPKSIFLLLNFAQVFYHSEKR